MKYLPTIALCLVVWITIVWARTSPENQLGFERVFAIVVAAVCWYTIGTVMERARRDDDED